MIAGSAAVLSALALGACGSADGSSAGDPSAGAPSVPPASAPPASTVQPASESAASGVDDFSSVRQYRTVALPTRVRIPAKGIDSSLGQVGLAADRTVAAPDDWQQAAWFEGGPRPGQEGPAVIVGHVDSKAGPAVFARLGELRIGQRVLVDRADGSTVQFRVTARDQFAKAGFPASQVYSPTLKPSLLLITCGGSFDGSTGHYRDNIVVTAVPE